MKSSSSVDVDSQQRSGTFQAMHTRALKLIASHCDIEERLARAPLTARLRGLYFKSIHEALEREGKLGEYKELFPNDRYSAIPHYPLADYLLRIACAGAIYATPGRLHDGMFAIARNNATAFAKSLLGRPCCGCSRATPCGSRSKASRRGGRAAPMDTGSSFVTGRVTLRWFIGTSTSGSIRW